MNLLVCIESIIHSWS